MTVPYLRGPIAPVFTAFNDDGSLDDRGQRELLDCLMEPGAISAYFVRSGLGQMYTFSYDEVKQITVNACQHLGGKAPVLVGAAGIWDQNRDRRPDPAVYVQQAVELSQFAEGNGADGVVLTIPDALVPKEGQSYPDLIVEYYTTVCGAVKIPVLVYQPPGTPKEYHISPQLASRLADIPNLKGMKLSNADAGRIFDLIWETQGKDFAFIAGAETSFYAALWAGARAVIGQGACLNPQVMRAMQDYFEKGDTDRAREAQRSINVLVYGCNNPADFMKRYAAEKGYKVGGYSRSVGDNPYMDDFTPLTEDDYKRFKALLESELAKYNGRP